MTTNAVEPDDILSIDDVTTLSRDVAAEYDSRLDVVGAASTAGEGSRVEVLVTISGCHEEPCVLMVNLTRHGREAFKNDLREQFRRALVAHTSN